MAAAPYSPWRPITPGVSIPQEPDTSPLAGTILGAVAALYRELIKVGISPIQADEMELWQIASLMEPGRDELGTPVLDSHDLLAQRVAAARAGMPEPDLDVYTSDRTAEMFTQQFGQGAQ